jgi:hypothetical protein
MAQVQRVTGVMTGGGAATLNPIISTLQNNMKLNKSITASDVNQLIFAYNVWEAHAHLTNDLKGKDTFGNKNVYGGGGSYTGTKATSGAKDTGGSNFPSLGLIVAVTNDIEDGDVNAIINSINAIRNHLHTINDVTS